LSEIKNFQSFKHFLEQSYRIVLYIKAGDPEVRHRSRDRNFEISITALLVWSIIEIRVVLNTAKNTREQIYLKI